MFDNYNPKAIGLFAAMISLLAMATVLAILTPPAPEDRVPLVIVLIVYIVITVTMFVSYISDKTGEREFRRGYDAGWKNGAYDGWNAAESGEWMTPGEFIDCGD
jgi:hypothetical protein